MKNRLAAICRMHLKRVKGKAEICLLSVVLRVFIDYNINNTDDV